MLFGNMDLDIELPQKKYTSQQNTGPPTLPDLDMEFSPGQFSVYYGYDKDGIIRYIGITKRDPAIRFKEHHASHSERSYLYYEIKYSNLSEVSAHVAEQKYINMYGFYRTGGKLYNKINSISPLYWDYYKIKP